MLFVYSWETLLLLCYPWWQQATCLIGNVFGGCSCCLAEATACVWCSDRCSNKKKVPACQCINEWCLSVVCFSFSPLFFKWITAVKCLPYTAHKCVASVHCCKNIRAVSLWHLCLFVSLNNAITLARNIVLNINFMHCYILFFYKYKLNAYFYFAMPYCCLFNAFVMQCIWIIFILLES